MAAAVIGQCPATGTIGRVPNNAGGTNYSVLLDVPGTNLVITINQPVTVSSLVSYETLQLAGGGILALANAGASRGVLCIGGALQMAGGTIRGGVITVTNGVRWRGGDGVLDGVVLNADMNGTGAGAYPTRVINGLELNGTLTIGMWSSSSESLRFEGSQTLSGTGALTFGNGQSPELALWGSGAVLTIAPGVRVRGRGDITHYPTDGTERLINQGTISADQAGGHLAVRVNVRNEGTMESGSGGVLDLPKLGWSGGSIVANQSDASELPMAVSRRSHPRGDEQRLQPRLRATRRRGRLRRADPKRLRGGDQ